MMLRERLGFIGPGAMASRMAGRLYLKTKNFHWHMSGPHFRDYHLLLDEQADQIFAMTDAIAERARNRRVIGQGVIRQGLPGVVGRRSKMDA